MSTLVIPSRVAADPARIRVGDLFVAAEGNRARDLHRRYQVLAVGARHAPDTITLELQSPQGEPLRRQVSKVETDEVLTIKVDRAMLVEKYDCVRADDPEQTTFENADPKAYLPRPVARRNHSHWW